MNGYAPLHVGHGVYQDGLTVFPIWGDGPSASGFSWNAADLRVTEREDGPAVSELLVQNGSAKPLVALEGDLVEGGWQDRMVARSLVLTPHEQRPLDALCVEARRWNGGMTHTSRGRRAAPSVRHGNVGRRAEHDTQSEVWGRIHRYEEQLGATASSSMLDHLDRSGGTPIRLIDGQRGVVLGIGGKILGAEIFGSAAALKTRWQGILDGALLDARLAPPVRTESRLARRFIRNLGAMPLVLEREAGIAHQVGSRNEQLTVSGIALGTPYDTAVAELFAEVDALLHLAAFNEEHPLLEMA
ncbi:ARPP-1 family domain-containing protein [Lysobacter korlensis]|uniref:ARPP-1 family domain-containing protein n=1 Tax=Lysobacter korlensis TaxID=553636 RepID=A0ABV6RYS4_9GAMM